MNATVALIGDGQLGTTIGAADGFPDVTDIAGTEGTHEFQLVAYLRGVGRLAAREYLAGRWRIRLEPTTDDGRRSTVIPALVAILREPDWKQPGNASQDRFSTTTGSAGRDAVLRLALSAMLPLGDGAPVIEESAPPWVRSLVEQCVQSASPPLPAIDGAPPELVEGTAAAVEEDPQGSEGETVESEEAERTRLIAVLKGRKVKGCNAAKTWPTATLRRKVTELEQPGTESASDPEPSGEPLAE